MDFPRVLTITVGSATIAAAAIVACSDTASPDKSGTFHGPVTTLSGGTPRSYVTLDIAGVPTDVGVSLTEAALLGLPAVTTECAVVIPAAARERTEDARRPTMPTIAIRNASAAYDER
jgi:hypothetical protein